MGLFRAEDDAVPLRVAGRNDLPVFQIYHLFVTIRSSGRAHPHDGVLKMDRYKRAGKYRALDYGRNCPAQSGLFRLLVIDKYDVDADAAIP